MKKILLLLVLSVPFYGYANNNASLFDLDETTLNEEFSDLQTLENAVFSDPMMTLNQAVSMNLVTDSYSAEKGSNEYHGNDFYFEWEGFLWGFLCCPIGFFTIAVNKSRPRDSKISFWIGVAASSVISFVYQITLLSTGYYTY